MTARSHSGSYVGSGDTGAEQHSVMVWSVLSRRPVLRLREVVTIEKYEKLMGISIPFLDTNPSFF